MYNGVQKILKKQLHKKYKYEHIMNTSWHKITLDELTCYYNQFINILLFKKIGCGFLIVQQTL